MVRIISPATIMVDNLSPSAGIIKIPSLIFRPGPKAGWVGVPTRRGDCWLPHFTIFGMLNELSGGTESLPPIVRDGRDRISGNVCILLVAYIRWWWRRIRTATWGRCGFTTVILRLGAVCSRDKCCTDRQSGDSGGEGLLNNVSHFHSPISVARGFRDWLAGLRPHLMTENVAVGLTGGCAGTHRVRQILANQLIF